MSNGSCSISSAGENVLFRGQAGVGKTTLAQNLGLPRDFALATEMEKAAHRAGQRTP